MKKILFLIALFFSITAANSQICKAYKSERETNPFVFKRGVVKLFIGQRIQVTSTKSDGRLKSLILRDSAGSQITDFQNMNSAIERNNAEKFICIDLNTIHTERGDTLTVLLIKNPYKKRLYYKIKTFSTEKQKFIKKKVLPVIPGLTSVVTWPYPVQSVVMHRFRIKAE